MSAQVVWFKKDFRTHDHGPLTRAVAEGPTYGLFVIEPEWLSSREFDSSHYVFARQCLEDLHVRLRAIGVPLLVRFGPVLEVLAQLKREIKFTHLHSHEETGLDWTFQRDLRVKVWCKEQSVRWIETAQFGVKRGLKDRDQWTRERDKILQRPLIPEPKQTCELVLPLQESSIPALQDLGLPLSEKTEAQEGGRKPAVLTLRSFLEERGINYSSSLSSPVTAFEGCSRLSPYLTWGNLSMSEVLKAIDQRRRQVQGAREEFRWQRNLDQFDSRLWWHCHFIQKLESEPEIEFENVNRAFNGMRESEWDEEKFQAWCKGETGFPLIDACMRALRRHGWINFRMRAMLISFASYQLWLHWRKPAQFLARQFVDFEPGIHYSQIQMQSGVTGINTIRIYSPKKQVLDRDPEGIFIRMYCPELAPLATVDLAEPHLMPPLLAATSGVQIGRDYPAPIVDPDMSYALAKDRIYSWLKRPEVKSAAANVFKRHGSRKRVRSRK